jgi:preprotein translocase subunit SecA
MKFISKNSNLRIVLKHGVPAEPMTGRAAVSGLYIKFENGLVNVNDETTINAMLSHPGFNQDFIKADSVDVDPYANTRREVEPEHDITEINYGHIGKALNPRRAAPFTPEQKNVINEMAKEMAMKIAPELAKKMLEQMVSAPDSATTPSEEEVTDEYPDAESEEYPDAESEEADDEAIEEVTEDPIEEEAPVKEVAPSKKNVAPKPKAKK